MKRKPPVVAEVSWQQVHAFRLTGHHLNRRAPKKDLTLVVGDIGGAQAQVMSAAELQVGFRVDCKVGDVRNALWKERSLVKTWLMRGTLHLVPAADLPLYAAAMSTRWIRTPSAWLKFVHLTEPEFAGILGSIGDALDGNPMTREELIAKVAAGRSAHIKEAMKSGWGGILKPVARRGLLCFGPNRGQSVTFVRPEQWLGSWAELDPDAALVEVARRYLKAYGPATKVDFARWWGAWSGVGTAAWAGLAGELAHVSVEGLRADILAKDLGRLARSSAGSSVRLLPAFDPYLMGHSGRNHLFEAAYRARVSRTAGWISPVVLVDGRVVATWSHSIAKGVLRVTVEPFRRLLSKLRPEIRLRAEELAATMDLANVEVNVV